MKVLIVKTSSMGDIIHTLPALTDAQKANPAVQFDWLIEESFAEIPTWHPAVRQVIPIAFRKWRKNIFASQTRQAFLAFYRAVNITHYDMILDAQGLIKSALLTYFAKGTRVGLDFASARESLASFAYQTKYTVNFYQHAITRMRLLFSQAFSYAYSPDEIAYGLNVDFPAYPDVQPYVVFLHGTTWRSKEWPESYWQTLAQQAARAGYRIKMSGVSDNEIARALRIQANVPAVDVLPHLKIHEMARLLHSAKAAVAVDTGFGHLAAALNVPVIGLYGPTNPEFTGALGQKAEALSATFSCSPCYKRHCQLKPQSIYPPCFSTIDPDRVWERLQNLL